MDKITVRDHTDLRLLEGLKNSDNLIIQEVYKDILPSILMYVKENNGTEEEGRDIFQDALIAVYKKIQSEKFDLTCSLKSYLRIICHNLWMNRLKNKNTNHTSLEEIEAVELDHDILEIIQQSEKRNLFYKYFNELAENCKQILKGFFEKKALKAIAKELSLSEGYVKKRKFMCKETLVKNILNDPIYDQL